MDKADIAVEIEPEDSMEEFMAEMNSPVAMPVQEESLQQPTISDENMVGLFDEILTDCRDNRKEIDKLLSNFVEMVINEGDSTTASKEALVNLVKIKSEVSDKMARVADMMLTLKLKENKISKVTASQTNHYHFGDRRSLLDAITKADKKKRGKS